MRKRLTLVALLGALALVAAACAGEEEAPPTGATGATATGATAPTVTEGGVVREETVDFGFTNAFDPTGEYLATAWAYYGNLLTRGLVGYPFEPGAPGNEVVPDLATDLGQVSADGLTVTFTLKDGIAFGNPLNRPITSADIAFAFQRINTKSLIAQYGNYYCGTIVGMSCSEKSQETGIEGISTPDDSTIVFSLEQPTGDLLYRLAMPATHALPPEVAGCFDKAGDYGRFVISSGPYEILGSDQLDATSCDTLEPISGFDPDKHLYFVRNASWDPATDDYRDAYPEGFAFTINTNLDDIFARVLNGETDLAHGAPPAAILQQYLTNPDLQDNLFSEEGDRTWYLTMNLIVPPFDDVHVRKAVNYVVDKAAMLQAAGGPTSGLIATTIEPPSVLADTADYDPYATPNSAGDVDSAKSEMAQSAYDSDGDGVCDADVCKNVLLINRNYEPWTEFSPILQDNLAQIGIELKVRELDVSTAYTTIQTTDNLIPIAANAGWGKDYGSPFGFDFFLFNTAGLACSGSVNYSNIGMSADLAKECGAKVEAAYNAAVDAYGDIPSVDSDMDTCVATPAGAEYNSCWASLDQKLMEEIVPWVPYRWGSQVVVIADSLENWTYDQSAGWTAYAKIGVNNGLTMAEVTGL